MKYKKQILGVVFVLGGLWYLTRPVNHCEEPTTAVLNSELLPFSEVKQCQRTYHWLTQIQTLFSGHQIPSLHFLDLLEYFGTGEE